MLHAPHACVFMQATIFGKMLPAGACAAFKLAEVSAVKVQAYPTQNSSSAGRLCSLRYRLHLLLAELGKQPRQLQPGVNAVLYAHVAEPDLLHAKDVCPYDFCAEILQARAGRRLLQAAQQNSSCNGDKRTLMNSNFKNSGSSGLSLTTRKNVVMMSWGL